MKSTACIIISIRFCILIWMFFMYGCRQKTPVRQIERSFYYWKSSFSINDYEQTILDDLKIKKLYIKFFDVAWDAGTNQPRPLAVINFPNQFTPDTIIPAVFITNECMQKMDALQVQETAQKIYALIGRIRQLNRLRVLPEIQMDCDWTTGTRDKYFALLTAIKKLTVAGNQRLSATIRLYQCKYLHKAGVPPVDRGLLMCYNMGNLKNPSTRNSILETQELRKYVASLSTYPLPLDVALPVFNWKVLFRNRTYAGLVTGIPTSALMDHQVIRQSQNRFEFTSDTSLNGYHFKAGDILRDEQVSFEELSESARMLNAKLKTQQLTVVLYHLDSITLSKYPVNDLEKIFNYIH